jgi:glycosyltransferase involved in cell wall biosynthesis
MSLEIFSAMKISVIIPTFNRGRQIPNLLRALELQSYREFEVIVINDGSTDNTVGVLASFINHTSLAVRVYTISNSGRARARNFGVNQAVGDLMIFFDDDTRPNPDAVQSHLSCHIDSENLLISGPYLYDRSRFECDFNYFRQSLESKWQEGGNKIIVSRNLRINGGNFSIRKKDMQRIGGFDERLRDKEDFKLSFDFKTKYGGEICNYHPTWVYHDDFRDLMDYIRRERASRIEEQKLRLLEPKVVEMFPERFEVRIPTGLRFFLARILRKKIVILLFQKTLKSTLLAQSLKYRIYDWILTMNVKYL